MARKRLKASDVARPALDCLPGGKFDAGQPLLTLAEARALRRSAPLTHAQLKKHLHGVVAPPQQPA